MSLSFDTNILLPALEESNSLHRSAFSFLSGLNARDDVVVSELVLVELYGLLRNPAAVPKPRTAQEAVEICQAFRAHPGWQVVGLPAESRAFHDALWPRLAEPGLARRRAYDCRTALSLLQQGVDEFATVNLRDFEGFGFKRVWNPLVGGPGA